MGERGREGENRGGSQDEVRLYILRVRRDATILIADAESWVGCGSSPGRNGHLTSGEKLREHALTGRVRFSQPFDRNKETDLRENAPENEPHMLRWGRPIFAKIAPGVGLGLKTHQTMIFFENFWREI